MAYDISTIGFLSGGASDDWGPPSPGEPGFIGPPSPGAFSLDGPDVAIPRKVLVAAAAGLVVVIALVAIKRKRK